MLRKAGAKEGALQCGLKAFKIKSADTGKLNPVKSKYGGDCEGRRCLKERVNRRQERVVGGVCVGCEDLEGEDRCSCSEKSPERQGVNGSGMR